MDTVGQFLLEEAGLSDLAPGPRQQLVDWVQEEIEFRVGSALVDTTLPEHVELFGHIVDCDLPATVRWLRQIDPEQLGDLEIPTEDQEMSSAFFEQASSLWMRVHCPRYEEITLGQIKAMRTELKALAPRLRVQMASAGID